MKTLNLSKSSSVTAFLLASSVLITGCFSSGGSSTSTETPMVETPTSMSKQLAMQNADSEPAAIDDAVALKADINAVFGDPNDEPMDIKADASINDVYDQAGY